MCGGLDRVWLLQLLLKEHATLMRWIQLFSQTIAIDWKTFVNVAWRDNFKNKTTLSLVLLMVSISLEKITTSLQPAQTLEWLLLLTCKSNLKPYRVCSTRQDFFGLLMCAYYSKRCADLEVFNTFYHPPLPNAWLLLPPFSCLQLPLSIYVA